jgi:hypothetical protein
MEVMHIYRLKIDTYLLVNSSRNGFVKSTPPNPDSQTACQPAGFVYTVRVLLDGAQSLSRWQMSYLANVLFIKCL